ASEPVPGAHPSSSRPPPRSDPRTCGLLPGSSRLLHDRSASARLLMIHSGGTLGPRTLPRHSACATCPLECPAPPFRPPPGGELAPGAPPPPACASPGGGALP